MKLVKDFVEYEIVFYWADENINPVSPTFHSIQHAEEWWKQYLYSQYKGEERRKTMIDRRSNHEKRNRMDKHNFSRHNPQGRRASDKPVSVEIDLFAEKIKQFK
ncbi:hypothetical protein ACMXYO_00450 [Neptuniibacter sp. QD37_6]|uniref:hypothetical protein n=1 Tax=Neptuniibacter sp. QD37_6 TaxID=3398210 RepID=UPI0039F4898A